MMKTHGKYTYCFKCKKGVYSEANYRPWCGNKLIDIRNSKELKIMNLIIYVLSFVLCFAYSFSPDGLQGMSEHISEGINFTNSSIYDIYSILIFDIVSFAVFVVLPICKRKIPHQLTTILAIVCITYNAFICFIVNMGGGVYDNRTFTVVELGMFIPLILLIIRGVIIAILKRRAYKFNER